MSIAEVFCIVAMVTHLTLGTIVLIRSPRNPINIHFSILLALFFAWSLGELLMMRRGMDLFHVRVLFTPVALLPFFFARFTALFPKKVDSALFLGSPLMKFLVFLPTPYLLFLLWQGHLFELFEPMTGGFCFSLGKQEFLAKGILIAYLALSLKHLSKSREHLTSEFQERRFRYTFAGLILPAAAGSMYIALGRLYIAEHTMYTFGVFPALGLFMAGLIGYAILRYQLLDIDLIFSIGLIYTLLTIILAAGLELLQNMLQNYFELSDIWTTIFSTLVIAAVFAPLKDVIVRFVDSCFGKRKFDPAAVMRQILEETRRGTTHPEVLSRFLQELQRVFGTETAALRLRSGLGVTLPESSAPLPELPNAAPQLNDLEALVESLQENGSPDLPRYQEWSALGYRHVFWLTTRAETAGAFFLGPKNSHLPYSSFETALIAGLCQEILPILENVTLVSTLLEKDRDLRELSWAQKMYQDIQANPACTDFSGHTIRLFSRLAEKIKGDLIDVCGQTQVPFIAVSDAFHDGIQAALTLHILRSAMRGASSGTRLQAGHGVLRDFNDPPLRAAVTLLEFTPAHEIIIANAGNIPPLLLSPQKPPQALTDFGTPLGFDTTFPIPHLMMQLPSHAFLLCATNGLAKVFGDEKGLALQRLLDERRPATLPACHELLQQFIQTALSGKSFDDDITYVLLGAKETHA
jgi:hypothetical protein